MIDSLFGISVEVSCQRGVRTMCTCALCYCFCLLLLSFLLQRNRRRSVPSICSVDCCRSTNCFDTKLTRSIQYRRRAYHTSYFAVPPASEFCTNEVCVVVSDRGCFLCFSLVFAAFSLFSFTIVFYYALLGNTVAITAYSFISVRLQPIIRVCAELPAGVSLPR